MAKAISMVTLAVLAVTLHVVVMERGWGLKPTSLGWVIGGAIAGGILGATSRAVRKE